MGIYGASYAISDAAPILRLILLKIQGHLKKMNQIHTQYYGLDFCR